MAKRQTFRKGDRVYRISTGQIGTVLRQYTDGYVVLDYDRGGPAELPASVLRRLMPSEDPRRKTSAARKEK